MVQSPNDYWGEKTGQKQSLKESDCHSAMCSETKNRIMDLLIETLKIYKGREILAYHQLNKLN